MINKLINKISNLEYAIDSKEILLNIIMIYNDKDEVKKILNRMEEKNIAELLEYIKDKKWIIRIYKGQKNSVLKFH